MDGEIKFASADSGTADALVHQRDTMDRPALGRPRTVRWFVIIGLALLVVLGALYGFNRYRSQAIATFFANNKPPPAQIAAVTAGTQSVPRFAAAIGSLAAVHQVTITPEVGGKVTAVYFTLASTWKGQIELGQKVNVTADAFPGRSFTATITTIEPQIRSDTRTLTAQATLANPDEALLPGMFVNSAVVLPAEPDKVVLPETAVDYTLYGDSVYVVREEGSGADGKPILKVHRTPVKIGQRWEGKAAILDGLKAGEQVVAAGQVKLQDGAQVIVTGNPPPQPPANPTLH